MLRGRLLARRDHRRADPVGRLSRQRSGRGRRLGGAHAARHPRDEGGDARGLRRADGDPAHSRGSLPRHAGHRVHRRGGLALHAPDAQRQAPGAGRRCDSPSTPSRRACSTSPPRSPRSTPASSTRCCTRRSRATPTSTCSPRGSPRPRAPPRARSCSRPPRPWRRPRPGAHVILVRPFTEADDVAGFHAAQGILTAEGGKASPRRAGRARDGQAVRVGRRRRSRSTSTRRPLKVGDTQLGEGDTIAIDGSAGVVTADDVPLEEPEVSDHFQTVLGWADEVRTLGVRANADTPEDAAKAREFGAAGHRPLPHRAHVHGGGPPAEDAGDDHGRAGRTTAARRWASCSRSSRRTSRACSTG